MIKLDEVTDTFAVMAALNRIDGVRVVNKFGMRPDIKADHDFHWVWHAGTFFEGHDVPRPSIVTLFSTSDEDRPGGSGAYLVDAHGLDNKWQPMTKTFELDGQKHIVTQVEMQRFDRAIVRNSNRNVGEIVGMINNRRVMIIPKRYGQTQISAYTIPGGHHGLIRSWYAGLKGGNNADAEVHLCMKPPGQCWQVKEAQPLKARGKSWFQRDYPLLKSAVEPRTDIAVEVSTDQRVTVYAGFDVLVIRDDVLTSE